LAGWPGLIVKAPDRKAGPLNLQTGTIKVDRMTNDILLILSDSEIVALDIRMEPEALHFGTDASARRRIPEARVGDVASMRDEAAGTSARVVSKTMHRSSQVTLRSVAARPQRWP
jgi:hypothetical protein